MGASDGVLGETSSDGSIELDFPTREPKSVVVRHICTVAIPIRSSESRHASAWEYLSIISARTVVPARSV